MYERRKYLNFYYILISGSLGIFPHQNTENKADDQVPVIFIHVAKRMAVGLSPSALSSHQKSACDANALPDCEITFGSIKTLFSEAKSAKHQPSTVKRIVRKKNYRAGVNLQTNTQTICSRAHISYYKKYAPNWVHVLPHPITYKTNTF